ncbi:MAG TPA: hypothetical protein VI122_13975 [Thermoleophilaceae bacterium]
MIDSRASSERPGGRRFWRYAGGLGVIGVIIALVLGAAFMRIGHDQRPRELPIAAVGTPATAQTVEAQAPGELSVRAVRDRAAARQEIAERDVHGAVVLGEQGVRELLIASAANSGVANFLRRTLGRATPDGVPRITDVRPLPEDDATGIDIALLLQVLLIGGSIAVVGIGRLLPRFEGDPRRGVLPVTFLAAYAVMLGFALTLISAAFGVGTDASFLDRVLAMALISAGVARVDRSARRPHRLRRLSGSGRALLHSWALRSQGQALHPSFSPRSGATSAITSRAEREHLCSATSSTSPRRQPAIRPRFSPPTPAPACSSCWDST